MSALWLLVLVIVVPLVLFLAWLAVSSCLGDGLRRRSPIFDRTYFRTMTTSGGPALSEQIEMENIFKADPDIGDSDEDM